MAEAALINANHAGNKLPKHLTFDGCINHPTFDGGWKTVETLYKNNIINVISILEIHSDVSRLYLLIKLDSSLKDSVIDKLQRKKIIQPPVVLQLISNLKDMLSDVDPVFLDLMGEYFAFDETGLYDIIGKMITKQKSYPKLQEYKEHVKVHNIIKSLTVNFKIEDFLTICPDPVDYFDNIKVNSFEIHYHESMSYLSEKFSYTPIAALRTHLSSNEFNLTKTVEALTNTPHPVVLKYKRKSYGNSYQTNFQTTENIEFLKEIAFIDHKIEILNHINNEKALRSIKFKLAKTFGELKTCECCFNDEVLGNEGFPCPAGHWFCSLCIKKGIEVSIGDNKINFKCFVDCGEEFNESIIKKNVDAKLYQRIMRLKQAQEIREASIEGLETCAFCDYSVILSPDLKVIFCLNPECKKETCRECREENHTPYRCDQIEKTPEVKVRTMIENKMTEVLIRTCYNCRRKFVKEDGCNKMTCICGAKMCYICRKPVDGNYTHFYHDRAIKDKCPLHTDENIIHCKAVEAAARIIVNELKENKPELLGKIDIDKLLPGMKKYNVKPNWSSVEDIDQLLATVTGENVEDISNLKDMRSSEPQTKKAKR